MVHLGEAPHTCVVWQQQFATLSSVLNKYPSSLLAALTSVSPPREPDGKGVFFFDRDWCVEMLLLVRVRACMCCATPTDLGPTGDPGTTRWLFRHVMAFVRDGVILTSSRKVLKRL